MNLDHNSTDPKITGCLVRFHSDIKNRVGNRTEKPTPDTAISLFPSRIFRASRSSTINMSEESGLATHGSEEGFPSVEIRMLKLEGNRDVCLDIDSGIRVDDDGAGRISSGAGGGARRRGRHGRGSSGGSGRHGAEEEVAWLGRGWGVVRARVRLGRGAKWGRARRGVGQSARCGRRGEQGAARERQKRVGSVYLYSTGSIQVLNVTDPNMVKELANCKSLDLGKPCYLQKERGALLGMGILTSNGDLWVHQRKVIAPELFMERVKGMVNLMIEAAMSMLNSWKNEVEDRGGSAEIVVDEFLRTFSADKAMAKQSMLIGVPGSRYLPTRSKRDLESG
uniref:Cytochrome P450 n=1 Tax=Oryza glaberrima TaxID=4538 RepID=I1R2K1_ORYGL